MICDKYYRLYGVGKDLKLEEIPKPQEHKQGERSPVAELDTTNDEEQKQSEWTAEGNCKNCGEHAPFWCMASTYHRTPFCYNCGAKMSNYLDTSDMREGGKAK